ncbi:FAD-dependent oxidoreductase [Paenalkalicoccus suaedae]|uniref:FAD-dependent oxidoreductase n=1 Tax=Paenalkalicoccus suaedae TaxID=2592382 RepID=A0A859FJP2_9BACI|nr:FAD-dependent oxidoreductase [Paenalkalicoccus suaedae]QKS73023.1 FAD-dependent oxidoreductase [Paenalkalicoccus suaedae]
MKQLVLAGGGHVHLHVIKQFMKHPPKDIRITLISPSPYQYYSGMFSGFAEGIYDVDDIRVDLPRLAQKANVTFVQDAVTKVNPDERTVMTKGGETISYDAVSFDVGSITASANRPDVQAHADVMKPNPHFPQTIEKVRAAERPVIVGGGAAGTEVALSMQIWREARGISGPLTLVSASELLAGQGAKASKRMTRIVERTRIKLLTGASVTKIDDAQIHTDQGAIDYDAILWLTGPAALPIFTDSGLATDERGFLSVTRTLQSTQHESIFAAGDCASLVDYPELPKNGVYAIRQAPVLYQNLLHYLSGETLDEFSPQKKYLSVVSIGKKRGVLLYGKRVVVGKIPWQIKHGIDVRYMKSFE